MACDRAWIAATLRRRKAASAFPLANLAAHGRDSCAPRAMRFWIDRSRDAVLGMTLEGTLMPRVADGDFTGVRKALSGRDAVGEAGEVRALLAALGLAGRPAKPDEDVPHLLLDLGRLGLPDSPCELVAAAEIDPALLHDWRAAYLTETMGEDPAGARDQATRDVRRFIAAGSHRVLVEDGTPVAMTGFNASLPDIVQIGGVHTPPARRGRGHARRAVALHLAEARGAGVAQATLFASGPVAMRTYDAVGFRRIGSFAPVLFRDPERIQP